MSVYYVRMTGSDTTGDGSDSRPWRTINMAISSVPAGGGDIIRIGAGTYVEDSGSGELVFNRAFAAPLTLEPEAGATVVITGAANGVASIQLAGGARNVVLDGLNTGGASLTIQPYAAQLYTVRAVGAAANLGGLVFRRCIIRNATLDATAVLLGGIDADGIRFEQCTITAENGDQASAVMMFGSAAGWLKNVEFRQCQVSGGLHGLGLHRQGRIDGLVIDGGRYAAGSALTAVAIGLYDCAFVGPVRNVYIHNVTTGGQGRGIDLGGSDTGGMSNLQLIFNTCDHASADRCGCHLGSYIANINIVGGYYSGAAQGSVSMGGLEIDGYHNTNLMIDGVTAEAQNHNSAAHSLGVMGTDGVIIRNCVTGGTSRGLSIRHQVRNALIENHTSTADDFGLRLAHDADPAYDCQNVTVRRSRFTSKWGGLILGEGLKHILVEDCVFYGGGDMVVRARGAAVNEDIVVRRCTFQRNPRYDPALTPRATIMLYGARGVVFDNNRIYSSHPAAIKLTLQNDRPCADNAFINNVIRALQDGVVFDWPTDCDGGGNTVDYNNYALSRGDFGTVRDKSGLKTLDDLRAAWAGYGRGTNDSHSRLLRPGPIDDRSRRVITGVWSDKGR